MTLWKLGLKEIVQENADSLVEAMHVNENILSSIQKCYAFCQYLLTCVRLTY